MSLLADLAFVFVAGLLTAFATGLGALPFFLVEEFSDRWTVALWGLASGIMVSASVFGLVTEGLAAAADPWELVAGLVAGVVLVIVTGRVLERVDVGGSGRGGRSAGPDREPDRDEAGRDYDPEEADDPTTWPDGGREGSTPYPVDGRDRPVDPEALVDGGPKKLVLILGVLTVHSFPEGVAVGVSFAELGLEGGVPVFGFTVPLLAAFMTVAIAVHNVPEGLAISIPLRQLGVSRWRTVGAAVFSSLPQPIGAVVAFSSVRVARELLPFGFGFAAGAMVFLVLAEFVPEALDAGRGLPGKGYRELFVGVAVGVLGMVPLAFV